MKTITVVITDQNFDEIHEMREELTNTMSMSEIVGIALTTYFMARDYVKNKNCTIQAADRQTGEIKGTVYG